MTTTKATRRSTDGWFLIFLAGVVVLSMGWYFVGLRGNQPSSVIESAAGAPPQGFADRSETAKETDAPPEPIKPERFRVVRDGVLEDTATGIQVKVGSVRKGSTAPLTLDQLKAIFSVNDDLRSDLHGGPGPYPTRLRVTSINVDAPVLPIGLDGDRALAVPRRADVTGWWSGGSAPGERGPTVIVGHYDSKVTPGVFSHLKDIAEGALVTIDGSDGSEYVYRVTRIERLSKSVFPTESVYGPTAESELRLVTCGGKFNRRTGHYVDNVIAYAELFSYQPGQPAVGSSTANYPGSLATIGTSTTRTVAPTTSVVPDGPRTHVRETYLTVPLPPSTAPTSTVPSANLPSLRPPSKSTPLSGTEPTTTLPPTPTAPAPTETMPNPTRPSTPDSELTSGVSPTAAPSTTSGATNNSGASGASDGSEAGTTDLNPSAAATTGTDVTTPN